MFQIQRGILMNHSLAFVMGVLAALVSIPVSPTVAGEGVEPIKMVEIGQHREFRVNGPRLTRLIRNVKLTVQVNKIELHSVGT